MSWEIYYQVGVTAKRQLLGPDFVRWVRQNQHSLEIMIGPHFVFDHKRELDNIRFNSRRPRYLGPKEMFPYPGHQYLVIIRLTHAGRHSLQFLVNALQRYAGQDLIYIYGYMSSTCPDGEAYLGDKVLSTTVAALPLPPE